MSDTHEPHDALSSEARDLHRALASLKEEIEAVDWYHQRVETCDDPSLRAVLTHNRDEEIEHACMTLEWLRRRVPAWDEMLRRYLCTEGPIPQREAAANGNRASGRGLGLGGLRQENRP